MNKIINFFNNLLLNNPDIVYHTSFYVCHIIGWLFLAIGIIGYISYDIYSLYKAKNNNNINDLKKDKDKFKKFKNKFYSMLFEKGSSMYTISFLSVITGILLIIK